jgi:aspartate oxidase
MMQHFIIDVSKETEADPVVTSQFRTIIAYYQKIARDQISNPKIKMLFDKVNESFKELERGTENLSNLQKEEDASAADDESEDSDPIIVATPVAKSAAEVKTSEENSGKKKKKKAVP